MHPGKTILRKHAVAYALGKRVPCRPKSEEMAVMFFKNEEHFWFHIRYNEFIKVFSENKK